MAAPIVVADSITRVGPEAAGAVVVNASHGGVYAAWLAAKLHAAAAIFNDAGVGRDRAGIGGLDYLEEFGIPAATVGHDTARIGDGADMMVSGVVSHANRLAASLGVSPGQACRGAAAALQHARPTHRTPPEALEAARLLIPETPQVWALNSASLVLPEHKNSIVVTGSHGGLLGGRPETALKYDVLGALYNDAGIGKDAAGISRLPALERTRHRGRDGLGGERAHRRRMLYLRGRHHQPGQRPRRGARPSRRHHRPRLRRRLAPRPRRKERRMTTRKTRVRKHVIADMSLYYLAYIIASCTFTIEPTRADYGYDPTIYTFDDAGQYENGNVFVQLKATDKPKVDPNTGEVIFRNQRAGHHDLGERAVPRVSFCF